MERLGSLLVLTRRLTLVRPRIRIGWLRDVHIDIRQLPRLAVNVDVNIPGLYIDVIIGPWIQIGSLLNVDIDSTLILRPIHVPFTPSQAYQPQKKPS
jgi:hypothetical protein